MLFAMSDKASASSPSSARSTAGAPASVNQAAPAPDMPSSVDSDTHAMRLAMAWAHQALWLSNPNPRVGCVLTAANGSVIASGFTQAAGGPHAEAMALRQATERGLSTVGATAFVTLEPCSHVGRTPPCCDALIESGIKRVVIGALDPNPQVAGQGLARIRNAGIEVSHGLLANESRWLNVGFFSRMLRQRPWVRLKMAASSDGVTALPNGNSQWITSEQARADGLAFRARSCAVLTGAGTVLADNPRLNVRGFSLQRHPHLVVVDSRLQTPPDAKLMNPTQPVRDVWLYHSGIAGLAVQAGLSEAGAQLRAMGNAAGKVDLAALFADLAQREVNEVHVEAGSALNGSLLREGLVDEVVLYFAPTLLGQGLGLSSFGPLTELVQGIDMDFAAPSLIGPDVRLQALVRGADSFLNTPLYTHT